MQALPEYQLLITFDNRERCIFDVKPYLKVNCSIFQHFNPQPSGGFLWNGRVGRIFVRTDCMRTVYRSDRTQIIRRKRLFAPHWAERALTIIHK